MYKFIIKKSQNNLKAIDGLKDAISLFVEQVYRNGLKELMRETHREKRQVGMSGQFGSVKIVTYYGWLGKTKIYLIRDDTHIALCGDSGSQNDDKVVVHTCYGTQTELQALLEHLINEWNFTDKPVEKRLRVDKKAGEKINSLYC